MGTLCPNNSEGDQNKMPKYIDDKTQKARLCISIDANIIKQLTERAAALKVSKSELVQLYCENGLERGKEQKPKE